MDEYIKNIYDILEKNNVDSYKEIAKQYENQVQHSFQNGFSMDEIIELLGTPEEILKIQLNKKNKVVSSSKKPSFSLIITTFITIILLLIGLSFFTLVLASCINPILMVISTKNTEKILTILLTTFASLCAIVILSLLFKKLIKALM